MPPIAIVLPILPGKAEVVRRVMQEALGPRRTEYEESRRNLGVTKEMALIQATPVGDLAILYLEADDPDRVLGGLAASDRPFDRWFREFILEAHGFDLAAMSSWPPPELLFVWPGG